MTFALIAALMLSQAPESSAEKTWRACVDKTSTNYDWAQCGGTYIKQADAALNAEWRRLMAKVDGQTKIDLVAEQRAWLAYRGIACKFYANGENGREGEVLHYGGCVGQLIDERTAELAGYREGLAD